MAKIFIAYSKDQLDFATQLAAKLGTHGHHVFIDHASLPPGEGYDRRIAKAVRAADVFVFVISPKSVRKGSYARTELQYAQNRWRNPRGRIIPVLADDSVHHDEVPPYLQALTFIQSDGNLPAYATNIVLDALESIEQELPRASNPEKAKVEVQSAPSPHAPRRGSRPTRGQRSGRKEPSAAPRLSQVTATGAPKTPTTLTWAQMVFCYLQIIIALFVFSRTALQFSTVLPVTLGGYLAFSNYRSGARSIVAFGLASAVASLGWYLFVEYGRQYGGL